MTLTAAGVDIAHPFSLLKPAVALIGADGRRILERSDLLTASRADFYGADRIIRCCREI